MYMIEGTPFTFEEDGFDYTDPEGLMGSNLEEFLEAA